MTGFVGSGAKPTPLSDKEIDRILQVKPEDKKKLKPRLEFEEQESVRVISGPFANFTGTDLRDQRRPVEAQGSGQHLRS